jgi:release factor glutamine methyltransferase
MFVSDNRVASAKKYFFNELADSFAISECKSMWSAVLFTYFGWTPSEILLNANERFSESDLLRIRSIVKRLQNQEPFQYIIGEVYFADLILDIDRRALIPRPETEELIDLVSKQGKAFAEILDICTGSGCIALALKTKFPNSRVSGLDLSKEAVSLAQENAIRTKLDVQFEVADVFDWKPSSTYDLIVSNPPYIPVSEQIDMQSNVLHYEPHMALFVSDQDPLLFYRRIIELANEHLISGGYLAFELHEKWAQETKCLLDVTVYKHIQIHTDLQGKERMLIAQKA